MTDDEYYGFDIVIPVKCKIIDNNNLPASEELGIDFFVQKNYPENFPEKPRRIRIRTISYEAFNEVCENPDILIIKKD